jgi:hypothetical protein
MVLGASALAERGVGESGGDVKLLPYHAFELHSPLRLTEALQALAAHVEPVKWMRLTPQTGDGDRFQGEIAGDRFRLQRIIGYRNSFLPVVTGAATADGRGARIAIRMGLPVFVLIFIAVWCLIAVSFSLTMLVVSVNPIGAFGLLMIAFMYALTTGAFWYEASKQEKALRRIFQALQA